MTQHLMQHIGMMARLRIHFGQTWPFTPGKMALTADYQALRSMPHLLADIALRNYVFAPIPEQKSAYGAGIAEGRRQCALELIKLSTLDHAALWNVIEAKPKPTEIRP